MNFFRLWIDNKYLLIIIIPLLYAQDFLRLSNGRTSIELGKNVTTDQFKINEGMEKEISLAHITTHNRIHKTPSKIEPT